MPRRFIASRSAAFHPGPLTNARDFVMLFGDEVETTGRQRGGRDEVLYRRRPGWVRSDRLIEHHPLELYAVDVGQGDATFIVTPGERTILVDGGMGDEAFQFLVWKYRLDVADAQPVDIDLLILTHTDGDHIAGLASIVRHPLINVRRIVHSGIARFRSGAFDSDLGDTQGTGTQRILLTRHDRIDELQRDDLTSNLQSWFDAVTQEQQTAGLDYGAVDATTGTIDIGDPAVTLHVLGPRLGRHPVTGDPVYPWLSSAPKTVNGHSVIVRLDVGNVRMLLPGDLNERGASYLMADPDFVAAADAHVLKAPHHGSHDFHRPFLEAVSPQISVISSGESPDHGHPRANFLGTVGQASRSREPLIFSTELVAMFAVDDDAAAPDADDPVDPTDPAMLGQARRRFKKRLNGIINIRTDGADLYAARRVAASYQFVTYGPLAPAARE